MKNSRLHLLIADDHSIIRKGLIQILTDEFKMLDVTECSSAEEVFAVFRTKIWDFILLDISMPGTNGIDILKRLRREGIKAPILMLSAHTEEHYALRVIQAGANGFVNKSTASEELMGAIQMVLFGRIYITPSLNGHLPELLSEENIKFHERLYDREYQVMMMLHSGKTISAIAQATELSENTINTYRKNILNKLHVLDDNGLFQYVIQHHLNV